MCQFYASCMCVCLYIYIYISDAYLYIMYYIYIYIYTYACAITCVCKGMHILVHEEKDSTSAKESRLLKDSTSFA